ncbi:flagellar assembly protein FliH [Aquisalibacillus elongatus]|uniref:Flagellar assembly protein FliH n=1 Tax=Aquisalibacillus elongatus TaxID=485577 RepID=A0A3N5BE60_9BACI|nr:flagellar assembly protein FliH [Aquisalibacillus elongatus]RPF55996.1 flagellar assembly protein FliH [Aquisalibacillus elongatus]
MSNIYRLNDDVRPGKVIQVKPVKTVKEEPQPDVEAHDEEEQAELYLQQAKEELNQAREQIQQMKEDAQQEIDSNYQQLEHDKQEALNSAREEGYKVGYDQGQKEAEQSYEHLIESAQQLVAQMQSDYREKLSQAEQDILEIAIKSSEKILNKTIFEQPEAFIHIVKQTLEEVIDQPEVTIRVNPNEYGLLTDYREDLEATFPNKTQITIYPDTKITTHSCVVESPYGIIDSSIDTQLHELKQCLGELTIGDE